MYISATHPIKYVCNTSSNLTNTVTYNDNEMTKLICDGVFVIVLICVVLFYVFLSHSLVSRGYVFFELNQYNYPLLHASMRFSIFYLNVFFTFQLWHSKLHSGCQITPVNLTLPYTNITATFTLTKTQNTFQIQFTV